MPPSHPSPGNSFSLLPSSTFKIFPVAVRCLFPLPAPRWFLLRARIANLFFLRDSAKKSSCHPFLSRFPVVYAYTHSCTHIHISRCHRRSLSLLCSLFLAKALLVHRDFVDSLLAPMDYLPSVTDKILLETVGRQKRVRGTRISKCADPNFISIGSLSKHGYDDLIRTNNTNCHGSSIYSPTSLDIVLTEFKYVQLPSRE